VSPELAIKYCVPGIKNPYAGCIRAAHINILSLRWHYPDQVRRVIRSSAKLSGRINDLPFIVLNRLLRCPVMPTTAKHILKYCHGIVKRNSENRKSAAVDDLSPPLIPGLNRTGISAVWGINTASPSLLSNRTSFRAWRNPRSAIRKAAWSVCVHAKKQPAIPFLQPLYR